jgi:zinc protease
MGTIDPGLFVVSGRINDGISIQDAEGEINSVFEEIVANPIHVSELEKVKNQAYSTLEFGEMEVMNRAMNLAFSALSGDANLVNEESKKIESVTVEDIQRAAREVLREENSSVLYYKAIAKN